MTPMSAMERKEFLEKMTAKNTRKVYDLFHSNVNRVIHHRNNDGGTSKAVVELKVESHVSHVKKKYR